jgi:hypothetical protein
MPPFNFCGHREYVDECGGHLESITTPREKAIVDELMGIVTEHAEEFFATNFASIVGREPYRTDAVWIGGTQLQGTNNTSQEEVNLVWGWTRQCH